MLAGKIVSVPARTYQAAAGVQPGIGALPALGLAFVFLLALGKVL